MLRFLPPRGSPDTSPLRLSAEIKERMNQINRSYCLLHKECDNLEQKKNRSDCTMQPRNFSGDVRIALIDRMTCAINPSTS